MKTATESINEQIAKLDKQITIWKEIATVMGIDGHRDFAEMNRANGKVSDLNQQKRLLMDFKKPSKLVNAIRSKLIPM